MIRHKFGDRLALGCLLLVLGWFYLSSLDYGFYWDDPVWYGHVVGKSWLELVKPTAEFHFYRPGSFVYNRLFLQEDGTFAEAPLHAMQVYWHLLNVSLTLAICRRLGLGRMPGFLVAALVALYPFSYQAVAWAAPGQPWAAAFQQGAWLTYLIARQPGKRGENEPASQRWPAQSRRLAYVASLALFCVALFIQESTVPLALLPLLFEWRIGADRKNGTTRIAELRYPFPGRWLFVLVYPTLAMIFLWIWIQVPRYPGVIGLAFGSDVAAYLAQGFTYPILGRGRGYGPDFQVSTWAIFLLFGAAMALLLALAWRKGRSRLAVVGLAWALLSIIPSLAGLDFSYVSLGSRLLYYAAPGINMLWVSALWPASSQPRRWQQLVGVLLLALILVQSSWLLSSFDRLHQVGIRHLSEATAVMSRDQGRYLFINFPDRYVARRPPYPVGYWGVTLAPVSVDLGDFSTLLSGIRPQTTSRAVPWIDTEARDSGPLQVDMRGVIVPADELYRLAAVHDEIYLSRYFADGRMTLELAGSLEKQAADSCHLAVFDEGVCLQAVHVQRAGEELQVFLSWSTQTALSPHLTIFLHMGRPGEPPLVQADGDTWLEMLPLTMWQAGDLVNDRRTLRLAIPDEELILRIGLYDRLSGERAPARTADGQPLPDSFYVYFLKP